MSFLYSSYQITKNTDYVAKIIKIILKTFIHAILFFNNVFALVISFKKLGLLDKNIYLCTSVNYFKKKYILKKRYGNIF